MPELKSAYLIHGDDHGRIAERRAKLRALAERESGPGGVELFEGDAADPEAVAVALSAMTFAIGRRFVIVEGAERWKASEIDPVLAALARIDGGQLTVAFFAREEGRAKVPPALISAIKAAGGVVAKETALSPKQLPRWVCEQAGVLGLTLDTQAARMLIGQVGERQQTLLRELEKLALELDPGTRLDAEELLARSTGSAQRKLWTLADAIVAGDQKGALRALVELRGQGERVGGLLFGIVRRVRDAHTVACALEAGESPAQIRSRLRMPPFAADRLIADARGRDPRVLRRALVALADLEFESRGGGASERQEDTAAVRVFAKVARA